METKTKRTVTMLCSVRVRGQERQDEMRLAVEIPAGVRDIEAFRSPMLYEEAVRMRCVSELGLSAADVVCYSLRLEKSERAPRSILPKQIESTWPTPSVRDGINFHRGARAQDSSAGKFYKSAADWLNAPADADADADMNPEGEAVPA